MGGHGSTLPGPLDGKLYYLFSFQAIIVISYPLSVFSFFINNIFLLPPQPGLGAGRPGDCPAPAKACGYRKWGFSKVIT